MRSCASKSIIISGAAAPPSSCIFSFKNKNGSKNVSSHSALQFRPAFFHHPNSAIGLTCAVKREKNGTALKLILLIKLQSVAELCVCVCLQPQFSLSPDYSSYEEENSTFNFKRKSILHKRAQSNTMTLNRTQHRTTFCCGCLFENDA